MAELSFSHSGLNTDLDFNLLSAFGQIMFSVYCTHVNSWITLIVNDNDLGHYFLRPQNISYVFIVEFGFIIRTQNESQ